VPKFLKKVRLNHPPSDRYNAGVLVFVVLFAGCVLPMIVVENGLLSSSVELAPVCAPFFRYYRGDKVSDVAVWGVHVAYVCVERVAGNDCGCLILLSH